ncbi:MAG: putative DNA binding domain-containing protein [Elusimicrobiota bacterium]|jgi:predicted HTH transcriptional regulator|nr:putative DNA binding domain-containing protein [Elusimicrobiota bacterium]
MQPESNRIEYKRELTDKLEREVAAFLNYNEGGHIYIGIDDKGNALGIDNIDSVQLKIIDRIKNNIRPSVLGLFDVVIENMDGKEIINLIISSGSEKPYYIKDKGMSEAGCFIRVGNSTQSMTMKMIDELYVKRNRITLSNKLSPRRQLSFEQLKIYYEEKGLRLNEQFKTNLEFLTSSGEYNYAAYLLADENGESIKVAKYDGTNKVDLLENAEYGYCCLIKSAKRVLEKLIVENTTFAKITHKERIESNKVDRVALREAVINAIVHNDYAVAPPLFEIFSDRITITSYGGLPSGLTREGFFKSFSIPRNRELMRVFKDIELVEQLGSGMGRILEVYDESNFELLSNFLTVTFHFGSHSPRYDDNTIQDTAKNNDAIQVTIQDDAKNNETTIQDTAKNNDTIQDTIQDDTKNDEAAIQVTIQDDAKNNETTIQDTIHDVENSIDDDIDTDKREQLIFDFCSTPKSRDEIQFYVKIKNRAYFTQYILNPLIKSGKLAMTVPNKPNSKNQKYIKTIA